MNEIEPAAAPLATKPPDAMETVSVFMRSLPAGTDPNVAAAALKTMQEMYHAEQDRQAQRDLRAALVAFRGACPPIPRNSKVDSVTKSGVRLTYRFAGLDDIEPVVRPLLGKYGLAYRWGDVEQTPAGVRIQGILSHVGGAEATAWSPVFPLETRAGMSVQQATLSAGTFARRASLISLLGLTNCDPDPAPPPAGDDAPPLPELISFEEANALEELVTRALGGWTDKLRAYMTSTYGTTQFAALYPAQAAAVRKILEKKLAEKAAAK